MTANMRADQAAAKTETASTPQALQVLTESALVKIITCQYPMTDPWDDCIFTYT